MSGYLRIFYNVLTGAEDLKKQIDLMAGVLIGVSPIIHLIIVSGINAPYGRYTSSSWGLPINSKLAWFLQELPAFLIPVFSYFTMTSSNVSTPALILLSVFLLHYFNRTFIYSQKIRGGKPTPILIFLMAMFFCICNGYMQSVFLLQISNYREEYLFEWNFVVGLILFFLGMYINLECDSILRNLRKEGEKGYKIPTGNMFNYVTGGNLFGESLEWCGWGLACWSIQGFAFATFAVMYLSARSYSHHVWYLKKFEDYPKDRKIFIPYIV
uniref:3-oxo-5-alpha-steroid 4-dehydrogenase n=1 Tax=Ciona intestinalis TaxID=7719 RepID=A0A1W2W0N1_CIOIN|nr:3-oxo-5-alpha-steroid 4-dehydrogenase 1-like [Ciona intestinalis]|eukprot:XP_002120345.1 3-oxo-5-alpha-steroid 4-dehydrogenase 1-like [Ciona intestinalis]